MELERILRVWVDACSLRDTGPDNLRAQAELEIIPLPAAEYVAEHVCTAKCIREFSVDVKKKFGGLVHAEHAFQDGKAV